MSEDALRLDKWLWHARFYKSRTLATTACASHRIRINGVRVGKSHYRVKPGDILTFPQGPHIRIVQVLALGTRRGPAPEARLLYQDLAPRAAPKLDDQQPEQDTPDQATPPKAEPPTPSDARPA